MERSPRCIGGAPAEPAAAPDRVRSFTLVAPGVGHFVAAATGFAARLDGFLRSAT